MSLHCITGGKREEYKKQIITELFSIFKSYEKEHDKGFLGDLSYLKNKNLTQESTMKENYHTGEFTPRELERIAQSDI